MKAMRKGLFSVAMMLMSVTYMFAQQEVNLGENLWYTRYYESMNSTNPPAEDWYAVDYDDSSWKNLNNPIAFPEYDSFWVRRHFFLTENPQSHNFRIRLAHDDHSDIYINGHSIHECGGCGRYCYYNVPNEYLVAGQNVLAVSVRDNGSDRYLECYLEQSDGTESIIQDLPVEPIFVLSKSSLSLYTYEGLSESKLVAQLITPEGVSDAMISWMSSDFDIVDVNNGQLTAISSGTATITASVSYGGVTYSKNCEVKVKDVDANSTVVVVETPGTLSSLLTDDQKESIDNLTLFGTLNSKDFQVLRYMAGRNERGNRSPGVLATLDMYNVTFVSDGTSFVYSNEGGTSSVQPYVFPDYAFMSCPSLNSIILPEGIRRIGYSAFYECSNLEEVEIPESVKTIRQSAFRNCSRLTSIIIPASVLSLEYGVFEESRKLESVVFEEGSMLSSIGTWAFAHCAFSEIQIPASVSSIGEYAFCDNQKLEIVTFEGDSQLSEIKNNVFGNCGKLKKVTLPQNLLGIGKNSFSSCGLTSIDIPKSVLEIGDDAFRYCYSLTSFNIPEDSKLMSIGEEAFYSTQIRSLYIPKGLLSIEGIFSDLSQLQSLTVHPDNKYYESVGGIVYSKRDKSVVLVPKSINGILTFPSYVTTIPNNLLSGCSNLKGVVIPSAITKIGENAFSGCSGMQILMLLSSTPIEIKESTLAGINKSYTTLIVPQGASDSYKQSEYWNQFETIEEVGDQPRIFLSETKAFLYDCEYDDARTATLTAIVIGKDGLSEAQVSWSSSDASIAKVDNGVVEYAGAGSAIITASVEVGGYSASATCLVTTVGASDGKVIYVQSPGELSSLLSDTEKDDVSHLILLGSLNSDDIRVLRYMAGRDEFGNTTVGSLASLDMSRAQIVSGGEGYYYKDNWWRTVGTNSLGEETFRGCGALNSIVLPNSLTQIGYYAFAECQNLETVVLPDGLNSMSYDAFRDNKSLKSINIPSALERLQSTTFYNCTSLTSIDLTSASKLTTIDDNCFGNSGLTEVIIPASVKTISSNAFSNSKLSDIRFAEGSQLSSIGSRAFGGTSLNSVILPPSVVSISDYAFAECRKLVSVTIPAKVRSIGNYAFSNCTGLRVVFFQGTTAPGIQKEIFNGTSTGTLFVITPDGSTSYKTAAVWKDMANVYDSSALPILILNKSEIELFNVEKVGANHEQLYATIITSEGIVTSNLTWTSDNSTIATVDSNGLVSIGDSEGTTTIIVTTTIGGKTAQAECKVRFVDIADASYVNVAEAGTLSSLLSEDEIENTKKLVVAGSLNSDDIRVLRYMAGRDEFGNPTVGSLEELNMSKAQIVSGGEGYYKEDTWWHTVGENYLNSRVFEKCTALKSITLPSTLRSLEWNSFAECSNLETVVLPEGLYSLSSNVFANCKLLKEINVPSTLESMSSSIFSGCSSLTSIDLSPATKLTSLSSSCFSNSGLTEIIIPASIRNIGNDAFYYSKLKKVTFAEGSLLSSIGSSAFYNTNLESITLPASLQSIENSAFSQCSKLTEVLYEDNIKLSSIGNNAFDGCPIKVITLPRRLMTLGSQYFSEYLEQIVVEEGNKYFEQYYGSLCSKQDNSLVYVPKSLKYLYMPDYVTSFKSGVLHEHSNLVRVVLPSYFKDLGDSPFYGCHNLKEVYCMLSESPAVNSLTNYISNFTVYIPEGSKQSYLDSNNGWGNGQITLVEKTFENSLALSSTNIRLYNVSTASSSQLYGTIYTTAGPSLSGQINWTSSDPTVATVDGTGKVTYVAPGQTIVTATARIDDVDYVAVCNVSTTIVDENTSVFNVTAGKLSSLISEEEKNSITQLILVGELNGSDILYIREMAGINRYYWESTKLDGKLEYLDISNASIVSGGDNYGYDNETGCAIYTTPGVVGMSMFRGSKTLKTILLPSDISTIDKRAFVDCINLETIVLPSGLSFIDSEAFSGCISYGDGTFTIPESIDSLGVNALKGFEMIYAKSADPVKLQASPLVGDDAVVIVPADYLNTYRTADKWKEFSGRIFPDNMNIQSSVTLNVKAEDGGSGILTAAGSDEVLAFIQDLKLVGSINSYDIAIMRNRMPRLHNLDMEEVTIVANPYEYYTNSHSENNRLGDNAFRELSKLRSVILPKTIDYVGYYAFYNCRNLRSVKMFEGVNSIGYDAFNSCENLVNIELPEGLLSIGSSAFNYCRSLEEITIPSTVLAMGSYAFYNCYSLKSIVLPKNLSLIEWGTFSYCSSLESAVLPSRVYRIDGYAFYGCNNLKELRLPPMIETIGDRAFYDCSNIKDVYVYIANSKDIKIDMNTFSCWNSAILHIPSFSYSSYYWDTQWGQFYTKVEFSDTYDEFYTKNTLALNSETGTIDGDPSATLYEKGGLVVDDVDQVLDEVELKSDGKDGASLIASGEGSIKASKLTITIKVNSYNWHFFCFPFDIPLDSIEYDGEYVWRQYDGQARSRREGGWQDLAEGTTSLEKGRGYIFQGTNSGDMVITIDNPDLTAKDETTSLFTHESTNAEDANWNFVGNPYTAYYDINETTYSAPITVWTGNGYEAYRPGDDDYEFAPYQAFFVQTPDDADEIGFSADARDTYEGAQNNLAAARARRARMKGNPDRLFVNLEVTAQGDSVYTDKTRIVFNNNKSLSYETNCDAAKFFSEAKSVDIYSMDSEGTMYSINERPIANGSVELGIKVNESGYYTIDAVRMDIPVMLIDNELNFTHDLSKDSYSFSALQGTNLSFTLVVCGSGTVGVDNLASDSEKEAPGYDLGGRKIGDSKFRGISIKNGKKVLNK